MKIKYPKQVTIMTRPFYDCYNKCYKNIVTLNIMPEGPLKFFTRRVEFKPLSEFQRDGPCYTYPRCGLALRKIDEFSPYMNVGANSCQGNSCDLMTPDEIPNLFGFLTANGYQIDTSLTHMMNTSDVKLSQNRIICFATYHGEE